MTSIKNMVQTLYDKRILIHQNGKYILNSTAEAFIKIGPQEEEEEKEEESVSNVDIPQLATTLRALYPAGIKSGNFYVKSPQGDVEKKLRTFFKQYPEYTADQVKQAVSKYVSTSRNVNYTYMKLLSYFIIKDNQSMLAGYIDNLNDETVEEELEYRGDVA